MVDRVLPSLTSNKGLQVPQGSTMILGPDCLSLSDPDTPPGALTFSLHQPPQYGTLLLSGVTLTAGSNFSMKHIKELEVTYRHDGGPSQIDRFAFTASDTSRRGFLLDGKLQTEPVFFTIQVGKRKKYRLWVKLILIWFCCHFLSVWDSTMESYNKYDLAQTFLVYFQIKPLDKSSPEVMKLLPLWKAELLPDGRYGIFLTSRELKAQDRDSREEELIFCIVRSPYFGYLENITTGQYNDVILTTLHDAGQFTTLPFGCYSIYVGYH